MKVSKQAVIEIINTIPLLSMEDLALIFGIKESTLSVKFSKWGLIKNKELHKIQIFYKDKTKTCFFSKNNKNLVINMQIHTRLIAIVYAKIVQLINEIDNIEIYFEDVETFLHHNYIENSYQVDLLIKIKNNKTDKRIFILFEIETGSRSPSEAIRKMKKIIETQKQLEEVQREDKIITIIFQDSAVKDSQAYLSGLVRKYIDENIIFSDSVFLHSFNFPKNKINNLIQIKNREEIKEVSLKNILNDNEE